MYNQDRSFRPKFAPVKIGDELDVKIEAVGEKGDGIAKKEGFVLFVPNTKEGQEVKIRVTKVLRKVGFAEVVGEGAPRDSNGVGFDPHAQVLIGDRVETAVPDRAVRDGYSGPGPDQEPVLEIAVQGPYVATLLDVEGATVLDVDGPLSVRAAVHTYIHIGQGQGAASRDGCGHAPHDPVTGDGVPGLVETRRHAGVEVDVHPEGIYDRRRPRVPDCHRHRPAGGDEAIHHQVGREDVVLQDQR